MVPETPVPSRRREERQLVTACVAWVESAGILGALGLGIRNAGKVMNLSRHGALLHLRQRPMAPGRYAISVLDLERKQEVVRIPARIAWSREHRGSVGYLAGFELLVGEKVAAALDGLIAGFRARARAS